MAESTLHDPTATDLLLKTVARDPEATLFAIPDSKGAWSDVGADDFLARVRALAKGFLAAELHPGDALGVLSSTSFEATLIDFASAAIGVAVVPLEPSATQSEMMSLLDEARVQAVVVETARDFARIDELHGDLSRLTDVWQIGLGDLDKLAEFGRTVGDPALDELTARVTGDSPAAVFQSAPDGPDGETVLVTVTQGALAARAIALAGILDTSAGAAADDVVSRASLLQILPATDVHARVTTLFAVASGTTLGHLSDPALLLEGLASFRPTLLVAYPETMLLIDDAAHVRAEATGRAAALRQGLEVAVDHSVALSAGTLSRGLKTRFALADALVYRGLRKAVGGRLQTIVSIATSASLSLRLRHVMRSLDIWPLEGYGDVTTAGFATLERPGDPFERPAGAVGAPLDGVEVAVDVTGAVAFRGVGVAVNGDDGWLRTEQFGDLEGGRLVIDGRDLEVTVVGGDASADSVDADADADPVER